MQHPIRAYPHSIKEIPLVVKGDFLFFIRISNSPYQTGHSYYLFLNRGDDALYPHAIYSLVSWDFYFDASAAPEKSDGALLSASNAEEFILTMQKNGVVGERTPELSAVLPEYPGFRGDGGERRTCPDADKINR